MSIVRRKNFNQFNLASSIIQDINVLPSPICPFLTYVVSCLEIKSGRTFLSFSVMAFDTIFKSRFSKEVGL